MSDPVDENVLLRRQVEATLRFVLTSTIVGIVIIAILAALISGARGVLILVGVVYLLTSLVAYLVLRRNLMARVKRHEEAAVGVESSPPGG
ncbi:MAG TPA: hypothetical protein VHA76_14710 [Solirubrobacterales bacterium]|nr:hypothetical protein [Solirubrobacterales bacterium]